MITNNWLTPEARAFLQLHRRQKRGDTPQKRRRFARCHSAGRTLPLLPPPLPARKTSLVARFDSKAACCRIDSRYLMCLNHFRCKVVFRPSTPLASPPPPSKKRYLEQESKTTQRRGITFQPHAAAATTARTSEPHTRKQIAPTRKESTIRGVQYAHTALGRVYYHRGNTESETNTKNTQTTPAPHPFPIPSPPTFSFPEIIIATPRKAHSYKPRSDLRSPCLRTLARSRFSACCLSSRLAYKHAYNRSVLTSEWPDPTYLLLYQP